jgi:hypothetical protein
MKKYVPPRGRPKKSPEKKRHVRVSVFLTEADAIRLTENARAAGLTHGEWIIERCCRPPE